MPDDIKHPAIFNRKKRSEQPIRSTYSPTNAEQFRGFFDAMIIAMKDEFLSSEATGYTTNTLYLKLNDALKWLADNHPDHDKYMLFRGRIEFTKVEAGVYIRFKASIATLQQRIVSASAETTTVTWKDEFMTWLQTAKKYDIFERRNIVVTQTQKEYVESVMFQLNDPDSQVEVTSDSVKVMR